MRNIERRLDDLERAARPKKKLFAVLFADPDQAGVYWEHSPFGPDKGEQFTEDQKNALEETVETLVIVTYAAANNPTNSGRCG